MNDATACPLCGKTGNGSIETSDQRLYYRCTYCWLIYLDRAELPDPEAEVRRYREHQNHLANNGYTRFLNQAIVPVLPYLNTDMVGLDFGCGPNPVLTQLLERDHQLKCDYYDLFFFPHLPDRQYDFIFSTETFEHFFEPAQEIEKINVRIRSGGYLSIMTQLWEKPEHFDKWWYRRDMTHVCFYHKQTLRYIAEKYRMKLIYDDSKSVFVLQKS